MTRPIIVQKYGGSSVATVEKLHRVAEQVVAQYNSGTSVVVVVSAMGDTTDELLRRAALVNAEPPQRELDMLVTAGERVSMALLSMAIHKLGVSAISFTGSQSGIITDNKHQDARILEVRPYRLENALAEQKVVIVAGFQGMSLDKEITTLGRGGTDTTAVALAAALGAEACEIYSDVDGVYSADPRLCPQAKLLKEIDYQSMQEMARGGARVLNAQAVEFAKRADIKIIARKAGDNSGRQTIVKHQAGPAENVKAIVGHRGITVLRSSSGLANTPPRVALEACGAEILSIERKRNAWTLVLSRGNIPGLAMSGIDNAVSGDEISVWHGAMVTLVGDELSNNTKVLNILDDGDFSYDLRQNCVRIFVDEARCDEWVTRLHFELITPAESAPQSS